MEFVMPKSVVPKVALLYLLALGFIPISHAQQANPGAHTHGFGKMRVVYDAGQLMMDLETPAANLLGFEHTPRSKTEWLQVKNLHEIVKTPNQIVTLAPLCDFRRVKVKLPFTEEAEANDPEEHKEHDHEHGHTVHQDIHISYEWLCKRRLPPLIQIQVFESFTAFEKLNVQWVANGQQGAVTLDKNMTTLEVEL